MKNAAAETVPFLAEIIKYVNPKVIVLISKGAYDAFLTHHCEPRRTRKRVEATVFTPNGRGKACIYQASTCFVRPLKRAVELLMVGHPSKYARRVEWREVTRHVSIQFEDLHLRPLANGDHLVSLPNLPAYGGVV